MSIQIIYGRSGTGKTTYLFNKISDEIDNGNKKYIITPEQFSFTAEKELLKTLKEKNHKNTIGIIVSKRNNKFILEYVSDLSLMLTTYKLENNLKKLWHKLMS